MANGLSSSWAQAVADISTLAEFQNATIRIYDPTLISPNSYNIETGQFSQATENAVLYFGRARGIDIRNPTQVGSGPLDNPSAIRWMCWQIPRGGHDTRIKPGCIIEVTDGDRNPALESLLIVIRDDIQGSNSAARTFNCSVNVEADGNWSAS